MGPAAQVRPGLYTHDEDDCKGHCEHDQRRGPRHPAHRRLPVQGRIGRRCRHRKGWLSPGSQPLALAASEARLSQLSLCSPSRLWPVKPVAPVSETDPGLSETDTASESEDEGGEVDPAEAKLAAKAKLKAAIGRKKQKRIDLCRHTWRRMDAQDQDQYCSAFLAPNEPIEKQARPCRPPGGLAGVGETRLPHVERVRPPPSLPCTSPPALVLLSLPPLRRRYAV